MTRYALEAAIAALHAEAESAAETDWRQIAGLYDLLLRVNPSPVVALNRAVAIAMADGPDAGLRLLERLENTPELSSYHLLPAAKGRLLALLKRWDEAASCYRLAISLVKSEPDRRFLEKRLAAVLRYA